MKRIEFSKRLAIERVGRGIVLWADGHPVVGLSEKELEGFWKALEWLNGNGQT